MGNRIGLMTDANLALIHVVGYVVLDHRFAIVEDYGCAAVGSSFLNLLAQVIMCNA